MNPSFHLPNNDELGFYIVAFWYISHLCSGKGCGSCAVLQGINEGAEILLLWNARVVPKMGKECVFTYFLYNQETRSFLEEDASISVR